MVKKPTKDEIAYGRYYSKCADYLEQCGVVPSDLSQDEIKALFGNFAMAEYCIRQCKQALMSFTEIASQEPKP